MQRHRAAGHALELHSREPGRRISAASSSAPGNFGSIPAGTNRRRASRRRCRRPTAARASRRIRTARRRRDWSAAKIRGSPPTPGFQHAQQFLQPAVIIRQIAESERDGDQIERLIRQRQQPARRLQTAAKCEPLRCASTSMGWQKSLPKAAACRTLLEREKHVAGAAAQIEHAGARPSRAPPRRAPPSRAPAPVQIEGQEMIQQVVTAGDAAEHAAHPARRGLLAGDSGRRGAGHARTASMDSSTRRSSMPETIRTSPIRTGSTKCTLP